MFVGIGGVVMPQVLAAFRNGGIPPDRILVSALLLNIALILFGWRRYRALYREIQFRREAETTARQLAGIDPMTGFLNRRSLDDTADRLIADADTRGESIACLVLDLDSFKQVNDSHGHGAGDLILQECARRISSLLPEGSLSARIGGDEFACLVRYDRTRPQQAETLAAELIEAAAAPMDFSGNQIEISLSIGFATRECLPIADEDKPLSQRLLHAADTAMYHAKRQGRNRCCRFEPSMDNELRIRRELEAGIRRGIGLGEFVPYYEQQIDLKTGKLIGFEMLARWNSPALGLVNPQVFIPIAEEIGLIDSLSQNLIAQALNDAKAWNPQLTLSVNISPVQLRDPWFSQKLLKQLVKANFPPQRLEIEITESCLHENIGAVRTLLASLKNQGIRISLDDFGTGYSSLSQLQELPFDCIKIDRSFVMGLVGNKDSATIIRAITSLGEGLGLPITAEGIESAEVLEELKGFGNFKGQGYLYGQPETAVQTRHRLEALDMLDPGDKDATAEPSPMTDAVPDKARRSAANR